MKLNKLTPEAILYEDIPLREVLENSVYYPACCTDGRPVKYCNTAWRHLGINSFVYCDFDRSEEQVVRDIKGFAGYHILADRSLRPEEYMPSCWNLSLSPKDGGRYYDTFLGNGGPAPFAHWAVLERDDYKSDLHGPERFSFLYIGGEGLATFQRLYCYNHIAPAMLCFIQCWGFAGNWTDFTNPEYSFAHTLRIHPECVPNWLCLGSYDRIDGVLRLRGNEHLGMTLDGYYTRDGLMKRFGMEPVNFISKVDESVGVIIKDGRTYVTVSISCHLAPVVYEYRSDELDIMTAVQNMILKEPSKGISYENLVNMRAGFLAPATEWGEPKLSEDLRYRHRHKYERVSMAMAITEVLSKLYETEGVTYRTERIVGCAFWAVQELERFKEEEGTSPVFDKCRRCIELLGHTRILRGNIY